MPAELLNLTEAGAITGLGRDKIRRLILSGRLESISTDGRRHYVRRAAIEEAGLIEPPSVTHELVDGNASGGDQALGDNQLDDEELLDDELKAPAGDAGPSGGFLAGFLEALRQ